MEREKLRIKDLEIEFRPCLNNDIGFVYELMYHNLANLFNNYTMEKWSRAKFKKGFFPERIIIFEHEEMPVGFIYFNKKSQEEIYCGGFHLSEDYQGNELGKSIMEHIFKNFVNSGFKYFRGKIFKENKKSLSFIKKMNFFIEGEIPEENSYLVKRVLTQ